jgi:hypothetical protein
VATLLAYPIESDGTDVKFRVFRRNRSGTRLPLQEPLCAALVSNRGGECRAGGGGALVVNAEGLRAILQWYVGVQGDRAAIYGEDGEAYDSVCGAVETVLGFVPGGWRCGGK